MDFNRLVPMPAHGKTFYANGPIGPDEQKQYGKNNWYDWSKEHWGTKWNAREVTLDEDGDRLTYCFVTAWDCPRPLIEPLVDLAHSLGLTVVWDCDHEDDGHESLIDDHAVDAAEAA